MTSMLSQVRSNPVQDSTAICKVGLLIPAHNEEASISGTVLSALKQTVGRSPTIQLDIIVIADNCTDDTSEAVLKIIRQLQVGKAPLSIFLLETKNNMNRKAGALNQVYKHIRESGYRYVASADADTVWDPHFLENGLKEMEAHGEKLGGVCGRVGLLPFQKPPTPQSNFLATLAWIFRTIWEYLWWSFQNVEYSIGQSETIERFGHAHCLAGPGAIFRTRVLEEVYQTYGQVWPYSLTEDFDLTVKIQMLGYETRVGHDMFVYTDCPTGFRAHSIQRERWNAGNLSTYLQVGANKHTFMGGTNMNWQVIWFACRICLILTLFQILQTGFVYIDGPGYILLFTPLIITMLLNAMRFKYVTYKSFFHFVILVLFVYELYAWWYGFILLKSYIKVFTHSASQWR